MITNRDNAYISWILDESVVSKYKSFIPLELVEASVEEIYDKFYKNEVTRDIYDKLLAIDPTGTNTKKGKYLDWLIRKAYKNNKNILEDSDKIREDLELFDKYGSKLGKQIGQVGNQYDLGKIVKEIREKQPGLKSNKEKSKEIKTEGADKIYEKGNWLIVSPKTSEAACYYGKGTRWCTAADNNNYFEHYNKRGRLYIIIDKGDELKWQFHVQTNSFMDEDDSPLEPPLTEFPPEIIDQIKKIAFEEVSESENSGLAYSFLGTFGLIGFQDLKMDDSAVPTCLIEHGFEGIKPYTDYDQIKDSVHYEKTNGNEFLFVKLGQFDDVDGIWSYVEDYVGSNRRKDYRYTIFNGDPDNFEMFQNPTYKELAESIPKDIQKIIVDKLSVKADSDDIKDILGFMENDPDNEQAYFDLEGAYRDAYRFGTESDCYSKFKSVLTSPNGYQVYYIFPENSESKEFELWARIAGDDIATIMRDENYEPASDVFRMGFDEDDVSNSYGFDSKYFEGELKGIVSRLV